MTIVFQPPPTEVLPTLGEGPTAYYNPVWVRWFLDLVDSLNTTVAGGGESAEVSTQVFGGRDVTTPQTTLYQTDTEALMAGQMFSRHPTNARLFEADAELLAAIQSFSRKESPTQLLDSLNPGDAILAGQIFGG